MSLISQLLPLSNVVVDLDASSKKRVFEQAGLLFENNQGIARSTVFDSLFTRERLGSTGLGQGIAIPHGRIKGLKEATGALLRLRTSVPFDSPDGKPVSLLFVLLVPEHANEQHLQILSELAERFSDRNCREALAKASVLDLIDSLPDGLDTQVGELGDRLSEGERQRIGLARVFLRNADLVLFDEPTSRLDALNEAIILRSIHELSKSEQNADKGQDVAVVLVSHRESAMRVADAVLNL